tara:strand:- start:104 stop:3160 length:3057 start_codon:yes stop_codon:yes gene_type:complete
MIDVNNIGNPERLTQNRVIKLFSDQLGYKFLGDKSENENSNIEKELLTTYLINAGYSSIHINRTLDILESEVNNPNQDLYEKNKVIYNLLRYGVDIKTEAGKVTDKVLLIDWTHPEKNHFAIAEEVTLIGNHERRPDLVIYINGIAIGVIELKNSRVSIGNGIRQLISNQKKEFNQWFFSTVQIVFAGNDSEGLKYGTIDTEEKMFLRWKENESDNVDYKLDKYLKIICDKNRLLEIIYDFIIFDGKKKIPRPHQYFSIKKSQDFIKKKKGGIIWHTQGSGKSIIMVMLSKWILENIPQSRVAIITDRKELDKQIEDVFKDSGENIKRSKSGNELINDLSETTPRLLCSLIHKFGRRDVDDVDEFINELKSQPSKVFGDIYILVDECHRTQSGKMHKLMKAILPDAIFIGFTGTPLLLEDKKTTNEVFGDYIHTYKYNEAIKDGVVLDLSLDSRNVDQELGSKEKIDQWFEVKTRGLNVWQQAELKKKWATMQNVMSSSSRMERIVQDIIFDFSVKPRLSSQRGNAILVASNIYEACKYYHLFNKTPLTNKFALVTSYNPTSKNITEEDTGADTKTKLEIIYNTYIKLLENITSQPGKNKTDTYEDKVKEQFVKDPTNMKLIIVVDKLLTGFDAPTCTYLYIDKSMQDHGLFQAICRTNRPDGEDKDFGYIVDYKDLFVKLQDSINVYISDLDNSANGNDSNIVLQDRLTKNKEKLNQHIESLDLLCKEVKEPKKELQYIQFFCGNVEVPNDLSKTKLKREALYKLTSSLTRAYSNISGEFKEAGFETDKVKKLEITVKNYLNIRKIIKNASGETIDLKPYEADMMHLIDTYIEAKEPRRISSLEEVGLLEVINKLGINETINKNFENFENNDPAIAETIENNIRKQITEDISDDPEYFNSMSTLLADLIKRRKKGVEDYEQYLDSLNELIRKVLKGKSDNTPDEINTKGLVILYNNLNQNKELALSIDKTIKQNSPDSWKGDFAKEQEVKKNLFDFLKNENEVDRVFKIIRNHNDYS